MGEAEEELAVAAGGVFGAFDEFERGHALGVDGDVAAGVGEVFERVGHGVDDAGELRDGDGADVDGLGEFGFGEEEEAAGGGEEDAECGEGDLELVGAPLQREVGALEDLEHRGELVVGWVECGARFDGEAPMPPGWNHIQVSGAGSFAESEG